MPVHYSGRMSSRDVEQEGHFSSVEAEVSLRYLLTLTFLLTLTLALQQRGG